MTVLDQVLVGTRFGEFDRRRQQPTRSGGMLHLFSNVDLNIPRFEVALDNGLGAARTDTSEPVQGRTFLSKGKPILGS
jgi:hypothetical protein